MSWVGVRAFVGVADRLLRPGAAARNARQAAADVAASNEHRRRTAQEAAAINQRRPRRIRAGA